MTLVMSISAFLALALQIAVWRDPRVVECAPQRYLRRVSIVANGIAAIVGFYFEAVDAYFLYPVGIVVVLYSLRDAISASYRLWPEVFEAERQRGIARGEKG